LDHNHVVFERLLEQLEVVQVHLAGRLVEERVALLAELELAVQNERHVQLVLVFGLHGLDLDRGVSHFEATRHSRQTAPSVGAQHHNVRLRLVGLGHLTENFHAQRRVALDLAKVGLGVDQLVVVPFGELFRQFLGLLERFALLVYDQVRSPLLLDLLDLLLLDVHWNENVGLELELVADLGDVLGVRPRSCPHHFHRQLGFLQLLA